MQCERRGADWLDVCLSLTAVWLDVCLFVCSVSAVEPMLSLSDWLDGIQKTVKHSIQQCRDPESHGEWHFTRSSAFSCLSVNSLLLSTVLGLLLPLDVSGRWRLCNGLASVCLSVPWLQKTPCIEKPALCLSLVINVSRQHQQMLGRDAAGHYSRKTQRDLMYTASGSDVVCLMTDRLVCQQTRLSRVLAGSEIVVCLVKVIYLSFYSNVG